MNSTFLGNTSLLLIFDDASEMIHTAVQICLILRLPVNIYILYLIVSKHLITSEFFTFNWALFESLICVYDLVELFALFWHNISLEQTNSFLLGFILIGRPYLMALFCVEHYLAVVKPVVFLGFKPFKYKLASVGVVWLCTLISSFCRLVLDIFIFLQISSVQIAVCCVVMLYCCITTLQALKQPGPGEGVRQRGSMSNTKQRAFRIITIITVSVIIMHLPFIVVILLRDLVPELAIANIMDLCYTCTTFAGSIIPFLFLHKLGKMPFMKRPL